MFLDFWSNLLKCHTVNVLYSEKVTWKEEFFTQVFYSSQVKHF